MIRRLLAVLAHARAGHRIGCETCAERGTYVSLGRGYMLDAQFQPTNGTTSGWGPVSADPPARSPVDAARDRGEM